MDIALPIAGATAAVVIAGILASLLQGWSPRRLVKENIAGWKVGAVLGYALVVGTSTCIAFAWPISATHRAVSLATMGVAVALAAVGALDDLFGSEARGIGGHLRSLLRGKPTTGILKLVVGVTAAVLVALHLADDPLRVAGIAVLVATCTNLWNALDVVPGRALKWAAIVLLAVLPAGWFRPAGPVLAATFGATLALLPFDLRERGMLGDAGSNPLGFLVGLGLAVVLPTVALLVAATVALLLQLAAETVTISRLIDAVPPLRWFDRLGRRS
jgi:UDP-GlcNAc:undecaprenyl-phosphate GlcNAc-1-phosphate transferase